MQPRALLVDLGKVLIEFDHMRCCRNLAKHSLHSPEEIYKKIYQSSLEPWFDTARFARPQVFYEEVRKTIGLNCSYEDFVGVWNSQLGEVIVPSVELMRRFARHYKLVLLSNTNELNFEAIVARKDCGFVDELFPEPNRVLSYKVGYTKREDRMFHTAVERAGCSIGQCGLIDDILKYVDRFRALGGIGIHYANTGNPTWDALQLERQLQEKDFQL